jgi:branched-chain amino acid transport system permease protein
MLSIALVAGHGPLQFTLDALAGGSLYALFALGIALLFGIIRLANFAQGGIIMAGGYILVAAADLPVLVKLVLVVGVTVILSAASDRLAFRPIRNADATTLLVTSFAVGSLMQAIGEMISNDNADLTNVSGWLDGTVRLGSADIARVSVVSLGVSLLLLVLLAAFFRWSEIGLHMRAAAENFKMAQALGVRSNRVIGIAFVISGILAGIGSFLFIAQSGTVTPTVGVTPVLYGFVGTIVGGLGSLTGAAIGGFILGSLEEALYSLLPASAVPYTDGIVFVVVFAFLVVRPQGLFRVDLGERV